MSSCVQVAVCPLAIYYLCSIYGLLSRELDVRYFGNSRHLRPDLLGFVSSFLASDW